MLIIPPLRVGVPHTYSRILLAITTTGLTERNRKDVGKGFARVKKKRRRRKEKRRKKPRRGEERWSYKIV